MVGVCMCSARSIFSWLSWPLCILFFFSSRRRHTRSTRDWSSDVCSSDLVPPPPLLLGKVDFSSLFLNLSGTPQPSLTAAKAAGAPTLNYGVFLQATFDFIIIDRKSVV